MTLSILRRNSQHIDFKKDTNHRNKKNYEVNKINYQQYIFISKEFLKVHKADMLKKPGISQTGFYSSIYHGQQENLTVCD
jgi:hypothetical protein